jgi:hypothetical protein
MLDFPSDEFEVCHFHPRNVEVVKDNCKLQVKFQRSFAMSYANLPDAIMNEYQATTLRKLSIEAYQPKLFAENPTTKEAAKRIEDLKREIAPANSF